MLVLALDTSSPAVSAALVEVGHGEQRTLAESVVVDPRRHGELLAEGIRRVLEGVRPTDLTALVAGTGPGPFTGLRVSLVTAAAMADALGVPAYGVCSLDALGAGDRVAVADARRREVYWARYSGGVRVDGPAVERPAGLADRLRRLPDPPVLVGAGAVLHRDLFAGGLVAGLTVDEDVLHPSAPQLARLAAARVLAGAAGDPLTPLYLRRPDAVAPGATKRVTEPGEAPRVVA